MLIKLNSKWKDSRLKENSLNQTFKAKFSLETKFWKFRICFSSTQLYLLKMFMFKSLFLGNIWLYPKICILLDVLHKWGHANLLDKRLWPKVRFAPNYIFLCRLLSPISFFPRIHITTIIKNLISLEDLQVGSLSIHLSRLKLFSHRRSAEQNISYYLRSNFSKNSQIHLRILTMIGITNEETDAHSRPLCTYTQITLKF